MYQKDSHHQVYFSKIISEIEHEKFELIELNKYFENFIKIYFINSKNINLILDKADVNLDVLINKDKFTQVLINLVENSIFWGLAAFFFFRLFDIFKPGPIGEMDKMDGGIGVMMDDVVAGILTCLLMQSLSHFSL